MAGNQERAPEPRHMLARLAGFLYLVVVITGVFSLAIAPSRIFSGVDASTVLASVAENEQFFRFAILAEIVCYTAFLLLPVALYMLLAPAGAMAAAGMAALAMASVPIGFVNSLHYFEILDLAGQLQAGGNAGLGAEAMRARARYDDGMLILQVFWGLWLVPFGFLVMKGKALPGLIGFILMLAGAGYVIDFAGKLAWEGYADSGVGDYLRPLRMSEMGFAAWLFIFGARGLASGERRRRAL